MIRTTLIPLAAAAWMATAAPAQDPAGRLLQARQLEHLQQDPQGALGVYQGIATQQPEAPQATEAVLGAVRCLLSLGRDAEVAAFAAGLAPGLQAQTEAAVTVVVEEFATPPTLSVQDAGSAARIEGFIQSLSRRDPDSGAFDRSLERLGDLAEPYLVAAARQATDPEVVRNALDLLASRAVQGSIDSVASRFFAGLDPSQEPLLTLEALAPLVRHFNRQPMPGAMHPMLDRCAATELDGLHEAVLPLMATRRDAAARSACLRMVFDGPTARIGARLYRTLQTNQASAEVVEDLAQRAFEGGDPELARLVLQRIGPSRAPKSWLRFAQHPDVSVRAQFFERYPTAELSLSEAIGADALESLVEPFVQVLESGVRVPPTLFSILNRDGNQLLRQSFWSRAPGTVAYSGRPVVHLERETLERSRKQGDLHAWLAELPLSISSWRRVAKVVVERPDEALELHRNTQNSELAILEWLSLGTADPAVEELLAQVLRDQAFLAQSDRADSLLYAIAASSHAPSRTRLLLAVSQREEPKHLSRLAFKLLSECGGDEIRKVWRQDFLSAGRRIEVASDRAGAVAEILFDRPGDATRRDLVAWLAADSPVDTLNGMLSLVRSSSWSNQDAGVREAVLGLIASHPSPRLREAAFKAVKPQVEPNRAWQLLGELSPIPPGPEQDDADDLARSIWRHAVSVDPPSTSLPTRFATLWGRLSDEQKEQYGSEIVKQFSAYADGWNLPQLRESATHSVAGILKSSTQPLVVRAAARGLEKLRPGSWPDEWVDRALESADLNVQLIALLRLSPEQISANRDALEWLLTNSDGASVRALALDHTARFMDARAALALVEALRDSNENNRKTAMTRLQEIRTYLDESARWRTRGSEGSGLSPLATLLQQARDEDPQVRLAAVRGLGALGDPEALPALIEMLRGEDAAVVEAAEASIERLLRRD